MSESRVHMGWKYWLKLCVCTFRGPYWLNPKIPINSQLSMSLEFIPAEPHRLFRFWLRINIRTTETGSLFNFFFQNGLSWSYELPEFLHLHYYSGVISTVILFLKCTTRRENLTRFDKNSLIVSFSWIGYIIITIHIDRFRKKK